MRAGLLLFLAAVCLAGCGGKKTENPQSTILSAAGMDSQETDRIPGSAAPPQTDTDGEKAEDVVNGFRFTSCDEMVYCIGHGVHLREKPGLDGETVGTLKYGAYVHRIGKNAKWSRLLVDGETVYAASEFLSPYAPEPESDPETAGDEAEQAAGTEGSTDEEPAADDD